MEVPTDTPTDAPAEEPQTAEPAEEGEPYDGGPIPEVPAEEEDGS